MRKASANMWHAAFLLLIFSMINLAATPFSFAAIGQTTPTLSLISAACAAGMAVKTMNKTKKTAVFILLTILFACSLIGCTKPAKVESTEDSTVQVKIVDQYYRGPYMTSMYTGKSFMYMPHPAVYRITVEYNGEQYYLTDKESYELYHDKI